MEQRALVAAGLVGAFLVAEAAISLRHERALRHRGAVEPPGDVHRWMRVAYPGSFAAMIGEALWRGLPAPPVWWAGLAIFLASKSLKFWAIRALGPLWSFRVLIVPGQALVVRGPYRFLRHPNYVAVVGELLSTALMFGSVLAGPAAVVGFGWLLKRRIAVENRALRESRIEN